MLIAPYDLFKMAAAERLGAELENLCRRTAVQSFAELAPRPDELLLFLNLDLAATDDHDELPAALAALVRDANLLPRNVAVEFLEARLEDVGRFGALADALREHGFLVVLDDVGAGHSNLDRIPLFRPDVIKVDRSLISGVGDDFYKQETLKSLVSLSRRIGALVVAEGIETERRGDRRAGAGRRPASGILPEPAPAGDRVRRRRARRARASNNSPTASRTTWSPRSTSASASTGAST